MQSGRNKMFPIALDLTKIPILLIGKGEAFEKRHKQLLEYGASLTSPSPLVGEGWGGGCNFARTEFNNFTPLQTISTPHPNPPPQGGRELFENVAIVMVAGLPYEQSKQIFDAARAAGKLVNVEDMNDLCDFYFTANVKRGDLFIAVSTSGASPTLSRKIRDYIAAKFGAEWEERTEEMKNFRKNLKEQGKNIPQVLEASEIFLKEKGWLK